MTSMHAEVISDAGFEEPKGNLAIMTANDGSKQPAQVPALQVSLHLFLLLCSVCFSLVCSEHKSDLVIN